MKIGIITFTVNNFGAQLQAFALQHKLELLGYDAEICDIQIEPASKKILYIAKIKEWIRSLFSRDFFRTVQRIVNKVRRVNDCRIEKYSGVGFHEFKSKFLVCSHRFTANYIRENPNLYDVYIAGSDQVWSYTMSSILDIYFMNFTQNKKFSYAASFGVNKIPSWLSKKYSNYLNMLDGISIREQQGVLLAKQLTSKDVVKVVDPTFLLNKDEWAKIFDNSLTPKNPYIFVYDLIDSSFLTDYVLWMAKNEDLEIISSSNKTPQQFLSLIANAKHVVTTSFHAVALSINFGVNFTVICRLSKHTNSRMIDLCADYAMGEHVLMEGGGFFIPKLVIGYENKLDEDVKSSIKYLCDYLN